MGRFKYLFIFTLPALALISFHSYGVLAYLPVLEAFVLIPILELFFAPNPSNLNETEKAKRMGDLTYKIVLRAIIPFQLIWGYFLLLQTTADLDNVTFVGRILSYGIMCGVIGINVAHELGHKTSKTDQFFAKVLLTTSLYTHFFLEHNYGHHKNVGTPEDPSTARKGEWVYAFWLRSIIFSYRSAWKIANVRSKGKFWRNEMLAYTLVQFVLLYSIYCAFGGRGLMAFAGAAVTGWILLETVQYIEHYGLMRSRVNAHRFESVNPTHSWNSNHQWGRAILFELSRHSDHHFLPHKEYVVLDHHEKSPQLPTGYPGMMLLSLIPPLYFRVVKRALTGITNN